MLAAVLIIGLWWLVAHNAGSGWVQVLGDLVFGALLIGLVAPGLAVSRLRLSVRRAPSDGNAGLPVTLHVEASTRVRVRPVEPPGPEVFVGPGGHRGREADSVTLVPAHRGVHDAVTLDVASAAPFALQWWTRRVTLRLPAPLHVSPRCGRTRTPTMLADEGTGDAPIVPVPTRAFPAAPAPTHRGTAVVWSTGARRRMPGR